MKRGIVIFGCGQTAQVIAALFAKYDSEYRYVVSGYKPVAFTVDEKFITDKEMMGLPVVPFEELVARYPPELFDVFVAITFTGLNANRAAVMERVKQKGYNLKSYVSPDATVFPGVTHGENCLILEHNVIQPFVTIGDGVFLWSGNHVGHHSKISNHVFVASHAVISGAVEIGERSFIGVNATIRDNVKIGSRCVIGAGALILSDCEADGVYSPGGTERSRVPSYRLRGI